MIQVARAGLSIALLVTVWRHAHWSIALALALTLLACEVLSSMAWNLSVRVAALTQLLKIYEERLDAIEERRR